MAQLPYSTRPEGYYGMHRCLNDFMEHQRAAQKALRLMARWVEDYNLENPLAAARPRLVVDNTTARRPGRYRPNPDPDSSAA
jgi:hypothetical protein